MESLGWIVATGLTLVMIGIVIGARLFRPPTIINSPHAEAHATGGNASGGAGSGAGIGGLIGPLAIGFVAVATVVALSNANANVSDTAQRSIEAQQEAVKAIPTPIIVTQPDPVIVRQPDPVVVTQPQSANDLVMELFKIVTLAVMGIGTVGIIACAIWFVVERRGHRQKRSGSTPITHPAFDIAKQNVRQQR